MPQRLSILKSRLAAYPWRLWWTQFRRVAIIDAKRNLFSWRGAWIYFLAFVPAGIVLLRVLFDRVTSSALQDDTKIFAGIMQFYYIRLGIFFGCLGIFSRLIRGEMVERSLHYYLLSPVRREVLLLGKFAAGMMTAVLLFGTAILAAYTLLYSRLGEYGTEFMTHGAGMEHLKAYLAITVLACFGYGAIFLLLSMLFKNPTPVAMLVMGWEAINPIMPSLLQKISIASYLRHLMPFTVPGEGIFSLLSVVTEPVRPWAAALGIVAVTVVVLIFACYRMRTLEIRYISN